VVLKEFGFSHCITIHKLVCFHGRSECRCVVITFALVDIQETQLVTGRVMSLLIFFFDYLSRGDRVNSMRSFLSFFKEGYVVGLWGTMSNCCKFNK
jgi:hypothetical protein